MLLLNIEVSQLYEIIILLANLNYLVIWNNNLKLSVSISQTKVYLGLGRRLLKTPDVNVLTLGCCPIGLLSICTHMISRYS